MSSTEYKKPSVRGIPIREWHELGLAGDIIPVTIPLEGDSMRPLIRRGRDRVTILPVTRPLKKGDIVLFQGGPERFVVHRVRDLENGRVRTLGDNCLNPDAWMPLENVWGIVVRMERSGRTYKLDTPASRAWGRVWMFLHSVRCVYKRCRSIAARIVKKMLRWK